VLLADEPTSGLDDAAAAAIMALVGELARSARMAAVCTIHQPSSTVYAGIDTLLLLSRGQTAYNGPAADLLKYLAAVGKPVPTGVSLTEHALNLVNADFMSESQVETMLAMWRKRATANAPAPVVVSPLPPTPERATICTQTGWLTVRLTQRFVRDREWLLTRWLSNFAFSFLYALVFLPSRYREQVNALHQYINLALVLMGVSSIQIIVFVTYSRQWPYTLRELTNDMYGPVAYAASSLFVQVVVVAAVTIAPILPPLVLAGWTANAFFGLWLCLGLFYLWMDVVIEMCAFSTDDRTLLVFALVTTAAILGSGFFVTPQEMPSGWSVIYWTSPLHWTMVNAQNELFLNDDVGLVGAHVADNTTVPGRAALARGARFWCDTYEADPLGVACYGTSLRDALVAFAPRFTFIDVGMPFAEPVRWMLLIIAFYKLIVWLLIWRLYSRARSPVKAQPAAEMTERTGLLKSSPASAA